MLIYETWVCDFSLYIWKTNGDEKVDIILENICPGLEKSTKTALQNDDFKLQE